MTGQQSIPILTDEINQLSIAVDMLNEKALKPVCEVAIIEAQPAAAGEPALTFMRIGYADPFTFFRLAYLFGRIAEKTDRAKP